MESAYAAVYKGSTAELMVAASAINRTPCAATVREIILADNSYYYFFITGVEDKYLLHGTPKAPEELSQKLISREDYFWLDYPLRADITHYIEPATCEVFSTQYTR